MNNFSKLYAVLAFLGPFMGCAKLTVSRENDTARASSIEEKQRVLLDLASQGEEVILSHLFQAAVEGDLLTFEAFKTLKIDEQAKKIILSKQYKERPLLKVAVTQKHAHVVKFLLSYAKQLNIDLNLPKDPKNKDDVYPLTYAVFLFDLGLIDILYRDKPWVLWHYRIDGGRSSNYNVMAVLEAVLERAEEAKNLSEKALTTFEDEAIATLNKLKELGLPSAHFGANILYDTTVKGQEIIWSDLGEIASDGKFTWYAKRVQDKLKGLAGLKQIRSNSL